MKYIRPKNWHEFQHYKDRSPIWIKLHKRLLDDFEFHSLPLASRALAPMLWLLASEYENGDIPAETRKIAFRLHVTLEELSAAFQPLLTAGFFEIIGEDDVVASVVLAEPERDAIPEKEIQVTSNKVPLAKANGRQSAAVKVDPWKAVYDRGKTVLGQSAGGIITNLRKTFADKPHKVMAKIEDAAEHRDPVSWINKFLWDYGPAGIEVGRVSALP